jgi:hypothetical protein
MAVWKRKDTGNWVCDFRHNGQRYVRTLKFARTRKEAEQAEKVIMADVFRQVYGLEGKKDCLFEQFVVDNFLPYSEANKKTFYDDVLVCRVWCNFSKGAICVALRLRSSKSSSRDDSPRLSGRKARSLIRASRDARAALQR